MGFEQLAELRDRLRAEKAQLQPAAKQQPPQKSQKAQKPRKPPREVRSPEEEAAFEAIRRLQKHFPLAFPVNPAPKVPLKEGILKDAEQHLGTLGISLDQLKLGIAAWCQGSRYWASMKENAPRLDLAGQPVGVVTASQALHAARQARRKRAQARRDKAPAKEKPVETAPVPQAESAQ
ncbi:ProQ/FinO family protein [Pseudomonas sp. EpS/L25]|uniref:ProQ/FinO family protein n=1 Tax=Pseudomonas sp. EpS/L25 TaxID=1749078 RepID=UPI00074423E4|nr:ProQ/FinO family protein [Pseudomonas sp. EpS/L25]KUM43023.1 ProQ activator of osmoprotectant transporter prop [Pseudomonas sp. EpS/L25]